jgi:hypothetical protein
VLSFDILLCRVAQIGAWNAHVANHVPTIGRTLVRGRPMDWCALGGGEKLLAYVDGEIKVGHCLRVQLSLVFDVPFRVGASNETGACFVVRAAYLELEGGRCSSVSEKKPIEGFAIRVEVLVMRVDVSRC